MQNPWIFRQFADAIAGRPEYVPSLEEKKSVLIGPAEGRNPESRAALLSVLPLWIPGSLASLARRNDKLKMTS
jgi:hypothetical protein